MPQLLQKQTKNLRNLILIMTMFQNEKIAFNFKQILTVIVVNRRQFDSPKTGSHAALVYTHGFDINELIESVKSS